MTDLQGDEQVPENRTAHFSAGASGSGMGSTIASALPQVQQATPDFNPAGSVLLAANQYSGVGLGSSNATMRISNPYGTAMRDQLKQSGSGKAPDQ